MTPRWANHDDIASRAVFEALHEGLTVNLIATRRESLKTCTRDQLVSDIVAQNHENYDFLPVVESADQDKALILGLFPVKDLADVSMSGEVVDGNYKKLSEEFLIGANASIFDFVRSADERPCRLLVSGNSITGLVSLSDLQKLPVRVCLFGLITGLELIMSEAIRSRFEGSDQCLSCLNETRQQKLKDEIEKSRQEDGFVDALLFTQFCDKADIIRSSIPLHRTSSALKKQFGIIQKLRDKLAHANEYAASPEEARRTCSTVRELLTLRDEIAAKCRNGGSV